MRYLNKIEGKDLARLNPTDFALLLRILLYAEAQKRDLARNGVHVSTSINVSDGGEDGRWAAPVDPSDYIPNPFTVYQIKAEKISPAEILLQSVAGKATKAGKKMRTKKAKLKPALSDVFRQDGCYSFFCSARYPQRQITSRITKMRIPITKANRRFKNAQLTFLDGDKIPAHFSRIPLVARKRNGVPRGSGVTPACGVARRGGETRGNQRAFGAAPLPPRAA